jgi:hypothetical protein
MYNVRSSADNVTPFGSERVSSITTGSDGGFDAGANLYARVLSCGCIDGA